LGAVACICFKHCPLPGKKDMRQCAALPLVHLLKDFEAVAVRIISPPSVRRALRKQLEGRTTPPRTKRRRYSSHFKVAIKVDTSTGTTYRFLVQVLGILFGAMTPDLFGRDGWMQQYGRLLRTMWEVTDSTKEGRMRQTAD